MEEIDVVKKTPKGPATVSTLEADLISLGVKPGSILLVHSSLSALGWVAGGPVAVVQALRACLGSEGTLVMPAYSGEYTDPGGWENPPVPQAWWPVIRDAMPAYDPQITPPRAVGVIAECFRGFPGVRRSSHPHTSFCALGPHAEEICDNHPLDESLGAKSPLGSVYDLDGRVLLLGVGFGRNSSFHVAEYRASYPGKRKLRNGSPVLVDGARKWIEYEDLDLWGGDFRRIGAAFVEKESQKIRKGPVAASTSVLFPQRDAVDFAIAWMETNRREGWRRD
ncbi:MAG: AAC(3) family N-acetyltransferase [Planctomycetota bacterium]|jgi:aminoglycoside 3-N-acetyltransferase